MKTKMKTEMETQIETEIRMEMCPFAQPSLSHYLHNSTQVAVWRQEDKRTSSRVGRAAKQPTILWERRGYKGST